MNRRSFLKLAVLTSGVALAGYVGPDLLEMTNASVKSLNGQSPASFLSSLNGDWQIPHLMRRAGFSASPDELGYYEGLGFDEAIDRLLNFESVDDSSLPSEPNITMAVTKPSRTEIGELVWWWVDRMIMTPRPLEERMTLFWHNHFATAIYKVRSPYLMFKQNQLLRSNGMGNFEDLLMAITEDPAMLIWLDGAKNRKGAANENYAREILEVFTTGRGHYTEDDVKAAARAFTGYTLDREGNVKFNPRLHDDGAKTFLGHTRNLSPEDIVNILAYHPATARRIATELFQYFANYDPSSETIEGLAQTYMSTNGNIGAVVEAILRSNEFISESSYLAQVKSPIDYVVSALRALRGTVAPKDAILALNNMGQLPFNPPSVFGWPFGLSWMNTSTMLDRINFPLQIQKTANIAASTEPDRYADVISQALFPEGLPPEVTEFIRSSTSELSNRTDKIRSTLRLTMVSPFYNLN